jgi:hypothetical protein
MENESKKKFKDVVYTKLYMNLLNELVLRSLLIQMLIVGAYFVLRHIVYSEFRIAFRDTYDDLVYDTKQASLNIQSLNFLILLEDRIDLLAFHSNLINTTFQAGLTFDGDSIPSISSGGILAGNAFHIDSQPNADYKSLDVDSKTEVDKLAAVLDETGSTLKTAGEASWVKAVSLSATVNGRYITVLKAVGDAKIDLSSIFKLASTCSDNNICVANCIVDSQFQFSCLSKIRGPNFSPLTLFSTEDDNSKAFVHSFDVAENRRVSFYFLADSDRARETLKCNGIQAAIFNSATPASQNAQPSLYFLGMKRKSAISEYKISPENTNHTSTLTQMFKSLNSTTVLFNQENDTWSSVNFLNSSMWGHQVFGSLQVAEGSFKYFSYQTERAALQSESIENLVLISTFMINFIGVLGWDLLTQVFEKYHQKCPH